MAAAAPTRRRQPARATPRAGLLLLLALASPRAASSQALAPNPFAPLPQVVGAASEVFADDILMLRSGLDPGGTVHVFYSVNELSSQNVYYTNNGDASRKGGWSAPFLLNPGAPEQTLASAIAGLRRPDVVDDSGRVHVAWVGIRRPPDPPPPPSLSVLFATADDVWYRRRGASGAWTLPENLTSYQPTLVATDGELCGVFGGVPRFGRQWWGRPAANGVDYTVAPNGVATLVWVETWDLRAYDPGSGELCSDANPPPEVVSFSRTRLVSMTTSGTPAPVQVIDAYPSTMIFATTLESDPEGEPHLAYTAYLPGPPGRLLYTRRAGGTWMPPAEPFIGAGGCFDLEIGRDGVEHLFWVPEDGPLLNWARGSDGIWATVEGTPIPARCDGLPFSSSYLDARVLEVTLDHADEPVVSYASIDYITPPPGQGLYRHSGGEWHHEPTVLVQNGIFINQQNLVAAVERTFAPPPAFPDEGLVLWQQAYVDPRDHAHTRAAPVEGLHVNRSNGDVRFRLPLFATAGHGPTLDVALVYKGRGALDRPPGEEPMGPGWGVSQSQRLFTMTAGDILYYPDPEYHAYAWIVGGDGDATALRVESPPGNFDFRTHRDSPLYLRAIPLPDSAWAVLDGADNQLRFGRSGAIEFVRDFAGNELTYAYDANGQLASITDAGGRAASFTYDTNLRLTQVTDPADQTWTLEYHAAGDPNGAPDWPVLRSVRRDADGATWWFSYQSPGPGFAGTRGALTGFEDPLGRATSLAYGPGGVVTTVTDAASTPTTFSYRGSRFLAPTVRPEDVYLIRESFEARRVDPAGFPDTTLVTNDFTYFPLAFSSITWALRHDYYTSQSEIRRSDAVGEYFDRVATWRRPIVSRDPLGRETSWYYYPENPFETVRHRLQYIGLPDGSTRSMAWTPQNEVASFTDERGKSWSFEYSAPGNAHLPSRIVDPPDVAGQPGIAKDITYDSRGRPLSLTDALGRTTTRTYDAAGDVSGLPTGESGSGLTGAREIGYSAMGDVISVVEPGNPAGAAHVLTHDFARRPATATTPDPGTGDHGPGTTQYQYDLAGNLVSSTDPLGRVTTHQYDVRNRRTRTTRPDGSFSTVEYDDRGNVTATVDGNGNREERDYDSRSRVTEIRYADGMRRRYSYDAAGNVASERSVALDGAERATTYEYDSRNRRILTTDALGQQTSFEYDAASNLTRVTDRRGNTTEFRFTDRNLLRSVKRPGAGPGDPDEAYRTDHTYDANGNRLTTTVWRKDGATWQPHTTTYAYDDASRLASVTDPLGRQTTYGYDDSGNRTQLVDPAGRVTRWTFDHRNRVKSETRDFGGLALATVNTWDVAGRLASVRDPALRVTSYTYDGLDRLVDTVTPLGLVTTFAYDDNGNRRLVTDANGRSTEYRYDARDRLVQVVDPSGTVTRTDAYDEFGNRVQRVDGRGNSTGYAYDDLDRQIATVYPGGRTITRGYDPNGNVTDLVDPDTDLDFEYDALNRIVRAVDHGLGRSLDYLYDGFDLRTRMDVKQGATVEESVLYSYDDAGQLDVVSEGTAAFDHDYNLDGTLARIMRPDGSATEDEYDTARRLTAVRHVTSGADVLSAYEYAYDAAGNRTRMDVTRDGAPHHAVDYEYDGLDRLVREARTGPGAYELEWTWDLAGNRLAETRNGFLSQYQYDTDNQLTQVATQGLPELGDDFEASPLTDRWEVAAGAWQETGGVLAANSPAERGELLAGGVGSPASYRAGVRVGLTPFWQGFVFHRQDAGSMLFAEVRRDATTLEDSAVAHAHGGTQGAPPPFAPAAGTARVRVISRAEGDDVELGSATVPGAQAWLELGIVVQGDSVGVSVNGVPALALAGLPRSSGRMGLCSYFAGSLDDFRFNGDGLSITSYTYDADGNRISSSAGESFGYDFERRLVGYSRPGTSASYTYDAMDRRIASTVGGATTRFHLDGQEVVRDLDGVGGERARYLPGGGLDRKLRMEAGGATSWLLTDALGSPHELTDGASSVTSRYEYEAFGRRIVAVGNDSLRIGFTQRELDAESGLVHLRARAYDPRVGGFLQRDPVLANLPLETYAYAGGNPVTRIDPMGTQVETLKEIAKEVDERFEVRDKVKDKVLEMLKVDKWKVRGLRVGRGKSHGYDAYTQGEGLGEAAAELFDKDNYESYDKAWEKYQDAAENAVETAEFVFSKMRTPRALRVVAGRANVALGVAAAVKDVHDIWWETHRTITTWTEEIKSGAQDENRQYVSYRASVSAMEKAHGAGKKALRDQTWQTLFNNYHLMPASDRVGVLRELLDLEAQYTAADDAEDRRIAAEGRMISDKIAKFRALEAWKDLHRDDKRIYSDATETLLKQWPDLLDMVKLDIQKEDLVRELQWKNSKDHTK